MGWCLLAALALAGCGSASGADWQALADGMVGLAPSPDFGYRPVVLSEFDVNRYFEVLDRLHMREGYTLDWVYTAGERVGSFVVIDELPSGSEPVLYARRVDAPRFRSYDEFAASLSAPMDPASPDYLAYVETDGTDEGYFQLVLLHLLGSRFYIYWHAAYGDLAVACDRAAIGRAIEAQTGDYGAPKFWLRLRAPFMRVAPQVEQDGETVRVSVVIFSRFEGFVRRTYSLRAEGAPRIIGIDQRVLVPYNAGIVY